VASPLGSIPFFQADRVCLLRDESYYQYLLDGIEQARQSILVAQFIVDARPEVDRLRSVRTLLHALSRAAWRGVDVRVLFSRFIGRYPRMHTNGAAERFLSRRGVSVRTFQPSEGSRRLSLHSKFAVVDRRLAIAGSHNWTPGAFHDNRETAIAVVSRDVATYLEQTFESHWRNSIAPVELA
jgi:phosphatidylserine/phosphatidylglycerophosphate/cardiolipin synthase-like enzyme